MGKPPPPLRTRILRSSCLCVALLGVVGAGFVMIAEDSFIYFPAKGSVGPSPGEELTLTASDGVRIHAWWVPHPQAGVSVLLFHGNAGNLEDRRDLVRQLREHPANVLAVDYRGYGKSEGKPSEEGLYRDARAAYDWLCAKTPPGRIVVLGKSLGGAVAADLASKVPCGGLILQSTFTSTPDMAGRVMPLFPARLFMRTKYDTLSKVPKIACPKLILHSREDEMIPFEMGEKLYAAAADPKECEWVDEADHNGMIGQLGVKYYRRIGEFLEKIAK
jgi:hypothetical protein